MQGGKLLLVSCAMAVICTAAASGTNEKKQLREDVAEHARSERYSLVDAEWHKNANDTWDAINFADRTSRQVKLKYGVTNGMPACASHRGRYEIRFHPDDGFWLSDDESSKSERIENEGFVSRQCFSPDDGRFIFSSGKKVKIYDLESRKREEVDTGTDATWSPDGKWIGFDDGKRYVLIDSQSQKRTQLFKTKETGFGVLWSPDSRYVTYTETGGSTDGFLIFGMKCPEPWRVWVWRVEDGAHDWVYQICKPPRLFHWVKDSEIVSE
ncbi:MAG: hypothetical protein WB987_07565 [Candidatus Acidiferrales bacterium]